MHADILETPRRVGWTETVRSGIAEGAAEERCSFLFVLSLLPWQRTALPLPLRSGCGTVRQGTHYILLLMHINQLSLTIHNRQ